MEDEKRNREMSEEELDQVSGGEGVAEVTQRISMGVTRVVRWDSRGNPTHWQECTHIGDTPLSEAWHFVCPHCGRLLHQGALRRLYCDPCDEGWFMGNLPGESKRKGIYPGC